MDQLKDSSAWLDYFEQNRLDRPAFDWSRPTPFLPPVATALARSLAHFQLGESGDGTTLLARARQAWPDDLDYVAALRLFVAQEREHADQLARLVARLGGTLVSDHWTDRCFRQIRHALGAGFEIQVLLTAEIVGTAYYRLVRSTGDPLLRQVCESMVRDEEAHLRFHCDRIVTAQLGWHPLRRALWTAQFRLLFQGTLAVTWVDHRRGLRAVGVNRRLFFTEARRLARDRRLRRRALAGRMGVENAVPNRSGGGGTGWPGSLPAAGRYEQARKRGVNIHQSRERNGERPRDRLA
jgi:hypothetical protein